MKKILLVLSLMLVFVSAIVPAVPVSAGAANTTGQTSCDDRWFLGFKPWWAGLTENDYPKCTISSTKIKTSGIPWFIGILALNILEAITIAVGYAAVGFLMYGGFRYATAAGSPDNIAKAKKTIQNAIIGLVIGIFATVAVNIVFNVLNL